jgi:putative acetyltransferase
MIRIRRYEDADLDEMLRIWYEASVIAHDFLPAEFWAGERETIRDVYIPMSETWLAEEDGRVVGGVVGFIALLDNKVGGLFIDPAHQRRGIGKMLLDHARSLRDGAMTVHVFKANAGARRFYERYGFTAVRESVEQTTGCEEIEMALM